MARFDTYFPTASRNHLRTLRKRSERRDPLQLRADLVAAISRCAEPVDGRLVVQLVVEGRDCDGVEYVSSHPFPASAVAFVRRQALDSEWADGPIYHSVAPPSEFVAEYQRDRTLEAFEDGHPHCIYSCY